MDDLISRQAAIDAFIEWYGGEPSDIDYFKELLDESPSAQPEPSQVARDIVAIIENEQDMRVILKAAQQWIPCSEKLPDKNGKYLVVGRQKAINILKFDGGRWYGKWGVVAWMPLPEPYKDKHED